MKRTLALLLIICLSFGLVACGKAGNDSYFTPAGTPTKAPITHTTTPITNRPTEAPTSTASHLHNYSENVIREVGCTTHGIILYTCSCSESYTDKIPATGHRWNSWRTVEKATELLEGADFNQHLFQN